MWARAYQVSPYKAAPHSWRRKVQDFAKVFFDLASRFYGLIPLTRWRVVNDLWLCCWLMEITFVASFFHLQLAKLRLNLSLVSFLGAVQYLGQLLTHTAVLISSRCTQKQRAEIQAKFSKLKHHLDGSSSKASLKAAVVTLSLTISLVVLTIWIGVAKSLKKDMHMTFYWVILIPFYAEHFKMMEFLNAILTANEYVVLLYRQIDKMGERNLERHFRSFSRRRFAGSENTIQEMAFHHKRSEDLEAELRQLSIFKDLYTELYVLFHLMSECFGSSLLGCIAVYFVNLVSHSYSLVASLSKKDSGTTIVDLLGSFLVIMYLFTLCWYCQDGYNKSRHTGCLIYKLVKPVDNKRYNDLVSEFSLQILHQRFVIKVKQFFNLDLTLLGTMVAAIITYLVILIQFMFTESRGPSTSAPSLNGTVAVVSNN